MSDTHFQTEFMSANLLVRPNSPGKTMIQRRLFALHFSVTCAKGYVCKEMNMQASWSMLNQFTVFQDLTSVAAITQIYTADVPRVGFDFV